MLFPRLLYGREANMAAISVQNLTFSYDGSADLIFERASFTIDTDWKLGFTGRNGRGKTTFLKLLLGEYAYSGSIRCPVPLQYFPFPVPDGALSARQIIKELCPDVMDWQIECEFNGLEIAPDAFDRPFSTLSNGERTKALLAALFLGGEQFLLIDEPTNHLDMRARAVVGEYLNTKKGFLLVSHDRALLDACTDHTLSINRANIEVQSGNFSSWQRNKAWQDAFELAENEKLTKDIRRLKPPRGRAATGRRTSRAPRSAAWARGSIRTSAAATISASNRAACSSAGRIWSGGSRRPSRISRSCCTTSSARKRSKSIR